MLLWLLPAAVSAEQVSLVKWRQKALECEKRGAWLEACRCYDEILRKDRDNVGIREAYQRCLRRLHLTARHEDAVYRQTLQKLNQMQALEAYDQVLALLSVAYPDRAKTNLGLLFYQDSAHADTSKSGSGLTADSLVTANSSNTVLTGAMYTPATNVKFTGNASSTCFDVISLTMTYTGNSTMSGNQANCQAAGVTAPDLFSIALIQ